MLHDSQPTELKKKIYTQSLPEHVAIIMDGNGRWAQERRKPRVWGHKKGVESVRAVVKTAGEVGIKYLTLYAFSEENWGRPQSEVSGIMTLLDTFVVRERKELYENNVRLKTIGRIEKLPAKTRKLVQETTEYLKDNDGLTLTIALSYGGRTEISAACRMIAEKVKNHEINVDQIDSELFGQHLSTGSIPDPDLLIRTSGEQRISNFLLWQIAYSELWFSTVYWPDFRREHFLDAIQSYKNRKRRFGLVESVQAPI
ncbi:MAG: isoprenyl transferase [Oligoflexales bacterium]|nr:isoprenyl transferase [Oligoflexales bacterium]